MTIRYETDAPLSVYSFIDILKRSTLAERRPVADEERIAAMLGGANILITAWDGDKLVGVSRALSDHAYCCYLSDLAVDVAYQKRGIGKQLIALTHQKAGRGCALMLTAAPAAMDYYAKAGMKKADNAFMLPREY